jgi:hypothetical protein
VLVFNHLFVIFKVMLSVLVFSNLFVVFNVMLS